MKTNQSAPIFLLVTLGMAFGAQAHDPKEHMKDAEKPDCKAMKDMDHSKMDMNDPVMQAMMKQCMDGMNHGRPEGKHGDENHQEGMTDDKKQQEQHQH